MISTTHALIPVFAVIMVGYLLRTSKLIAKDEWTAINHLCYYVLMPMLIIKSLSAADLSAAPIFRISGAMILAILVISILLFIAKSPLTKWLGISNPGYTSLYQGATRWHGFIALAIIAALYGDNGIIIGSIGLAIMIPLLNIINVLILSAYGDRDTPHHPNLLRILSQNPFIIACAIGIILNLLPGQLPDTLLATFDLIGRAALGISLLTVGAALNLSHLLDKLPAIISTSVIRLLGMPALMIVSCLLFGVSGDSLVITVICAAVPTAGSSFILAHKMGGDSELMAAIITFQVLAAMVTLPLIISYTMSLAQ